MNKNIRSKYKIWILTSYEATRNGSRRVIMNINTISSFYRVYNSTYLQTYISEERKINF